MNKLTYIMSTVGVFALAVSGCGFAPTPAVPASLIAPTDGLPDTPIATTVPPTTAPTKDVAISANGVDFVIPQSLGTGARAEALPEVDDTPESAPWDVAPVHYRFTLLGYPLATGASNFDPILLVYPAKEYAEVYSAAAASQDALRADLSAPATPLTKSNLPTIPFFNALLTMVSNSRAVAFQNGSGVRALTFYSQAPSAVTNDYLFYQYQGLSADGRYYLIAILPVTAPFLQANDQASVPSDGVARPSDTAEYDHYLATVADRLTAAEQAGTLRPSLSELDAFIQSIKLNSPTIVSPGASAACVDQATFRNEEAPVDNTSFAPNAQFVKQWTIYNTGTCPWDSGYTWALVSGDAMGGTDLKLEDSIAVSNGGVTVFDNLTAPAQPGTYVGYWALRDRAGHVVPMVGGTKDNTLYVQIVVTGP